MSFSSFLLTAFFATVVLFPKPIHADCRPGIDDCSSSPLAEVDHSSSASTYQCHYADWAQPMYHTQAYNCSLAARDACAELSADSQLGVWQNATYGNCWVGAYLPSQVTDPLPSADTLSICTDQVFKPMIETCIENPGYPDRADSAFLNVVVPPYGDSSYSWFVDYTKPAFIVTTTALVEAGQVPGISASGVQPGPYTSPDPAGKPAGCSQRGGYCPSGPGGVSNVS
ncbi:MAG: hypothetical protein M1812_004101 [Candelaria pacifica]|nr:MAG: hypothetical protein M1812_004101 [Candelaria pacifica]